MDIAPEDLIIKVLPFPEGNAVDYFQGIDIAVSVFNQCATSITIDLITLRFQPEWGSAAADVIIKDSSWSGFDLDPGREDYRKIRVTPSPLFLVNTNVFDVLITYRKTTLLKTRLTQLKKYASHLLVKLPPEGLGQVFLSYKDPEDLSLLEILRTIARRAGFTPYVGPADAKPGTSLIWEQKIPPAIKASKALFVIWTENTPFGEGVQREISIARKAGIREVPLIEKQAPVPQEYNNLESEITWFDRLSAPAVFEKTIKAFRSTI